MLLKMPPEHLRLPLYGAMHRPDLMAGCERTLFLTSGLLAALIAVGGLVWWTILAGFGLWLVLISLLRAMAKSDPQLSQVYSRYVHYRSYYAALATPWALPISDC